jgi:carbon-monoxide dehydrogenase medium subunit
VRVPLPAARTGSAYEKHPHPASRFAVAGVAAVLTLDASGAVQGARVVVTGLGPKATRAAAAEKALVGRKPDAAAIKAAAAQVTQGIEVRDDLSGTAAYRKNLAAVMAERAIARAAARAAGA